MTSANQGVRSGFELRVAALLADIAAANSARRLALVGAGRGVVVDWLLEIVAGNGNGNGDRRGTQAEAARALAHLVADPAVSEKVLGRPGAVPSLLRFIFSFQPKKPNKVQYSDPVYTNWYGSGDNLTTLVLPLYGSFILFVSFLRSINWACLSCCLCNCLIFGNGK